MPLLNPEAFDILGILAFLIITLVAIHALKINKPLLKWIKIALLIIGISGLIIDSLIVFTSYII